MSIAFDSESVVVPEPPEVLPQVPRADAGSLATDEGTAVDLSIVSANRRAETAELRMAVETAHAARMRFEALRLAEVADELSTRVAELEAQLEASRSETARMHGLVVATRIEADDAVRTGAVLASEVASLTNELERVDADRRQAHEDRAQARAEIVDLRAASAERKAKNETDSENLESAIRLAAEFDELRHARRAERDAARLEADRDKRRLAVATERIAELESELTADRELEDARLAELAHLAQKEVDDAFAAGSRLGDRAALRSAMLEKELQQARERIKVLSSGGCPDPSAHAQLRESQMNHPAGSMPAPVGSAGAAAQFPAAFPDARLAPLPPTPPPTPGQTLTSLRERIDALPTGRRSDR